MAGRGLQCLNQQSITLGATRAYEHRVSMNTNCACKESSTSIIQPTMRSDLSSPSANGPTKMSTYSKQTALRTQKARSRTPNVASQGRIMIIIHFELPNLFRAVQIKFGSGITLFKVIANVT